VARQMTKAIADEIRFPRIPHVRATRSPSQYECRSPAAAAAQRGPPPSSDGSVYPVCPPGKSFPPSSNRSTLYEQIIGGCLREVRWKVTLPAGESNLAVVGLRGTSRPS
jgi:hypothetical protein